MPDEPTNWELKRNVDSLRTDMRHGFDQLNLRFDKVPSSDLLSELIKRVETRVNDHEADIAKLQSDAENEKEKRRLEQREQELRSAALRRQILFTLVTSILGPIIVAIVVAIALGS